MVDGKQLWINGVNTPWINWNVDRERFQKFAEALPMAIGNPMYHWTNLELHVFFGYDGVLNGDTAEEVWNLCRKLVGSNFRVLLPCSMLAGAAFLLLVDNLSRNLLATEIPIGILTAFTGAPFFLYLMLRKGGAR